MTTLKEALGIPDLTDEELVQWARNEREKFLKPHKARFKEKKDPQIIIELIKLAPTNLEEDWILKEIVNWMYADEVDYIEQVFMHIKLGSGGKKRKASREAEAAFRGSMIVSLVDFMIKERRMSKEEAFRQLAERFGTMDPGGATDQAAKSIYRRHQDRLKEGRDRVLPFPYYGHDIVECHNILGEKYIGYRLRSSGLKIPKDGLQIFGTWRFKDIPDTYPLDR